MAAASDRSKTSPKTLAIEITVEWANTVFAVKELGQTGNRQFFIGSKETCDLCVDRVGSRLPLVTIHKDGVRLCVPGRAKLNLNGQDIEFVCPNGPYRVDSGSEAQKPRTVDLPFERGWSAHVTLGDLSFSIKPIVRERLQKSRKLSFIDWKYVLFFALSAFVHVYFLLACLFALPEPNRFTCIGCQNCAGTFQGLLYNLRDFQQSRPIAWVDVGIGSQHENWDRREPFCSSDPETILYRLSDPYHEREVLLTPVECLR